MVLERQLAVEVRQGQFKSSTCADCVLALVILSFAREQATSFPITHYLAHFLPLQSERAGDLGLQNADTSAKLEVCARRAEVAEAGNKQLTTELTETTHVSRDTKDTLDQTRARLEEANSLVQRLTSQLDSSEKDREAYKQSSDTLRIELTEARHDLAELEVKAREQVQDLERELRKALEVTENLERIREVRASYFPLACPATPCSHACLVAKRHRPHLWFPGSGATGYFTWVGPTAYQ